MSSTYIRIIAAILVSLETLSVGRVPLLTLWRNSIFPSVQPLQESVGWLVNCWQRSGTVYPVYFVLDFRLKNLKSQKVNETWHCCLWLCGSCSILAGGFSENFHVLNGFINIEWELQGVNSVVRVINIVCFPTSASISWSEMEGGLPITIESSLSHE